MVEQFIVNRSILYLFLGEQRRLGGQVGKLWWEQMGVDFAGVWKEVAAGKLEETEGSEDDETVL